MFPNVLMVSSFILEIKYQDNELFLPTLYVGFTRPWLVSLTLCISLSKNRNVDQKQMKLFEFFHI